MHIGGFAMCEWSRAVALSTKVGTPSAAADKRMKDNAFAHAGTLRASPRRQRRDR